MMRWSSCVQFIASCQSTVKEIDLPPVSRLARPEAISASRDTFSGTVRSFRETSPRSNLGRRMGTMAESPEFALDQRNLLRHTAATQRAAPFPSWGGTLYSLGSEALLY
jgi:hypothetical protein